MHSDHRHYNEADYLALNTNHFVEFIDGRLDILPMPTASHQRILIYLYDALRAVVKPAKLGEVLCGPLPVRLRLGQFREPDVVFMLTANASRKGNDFWEGADLVMEVVSNDAESHQRNVKKRQDYADAGISEYWIVDPQEKKIVVLSSRRGEYVIHGEFTADSQATSLLLPAFSLNVGTVFAAANPE